MCGLTDFDIYGLLELQSVVYLLDLAVNGRLTIDDNYDDVLIKYWKYGDNDTFIYILTHYPLKANHKLLKMVRSSKDKYYAKVVERLMKDNEELENMF